MTRGMLNLFACAALVVAVAAVAGCGGGAGETGGTTTVTVTDGFGRQLVGEREARTGEGEGTVAGVLRSAFEVRPPGGAPIRSVDGVPAAGGEGAQERWRSFLNGVAVTAGAEVREGDDVWWDHDRGAGELSIPAVVGAFPEPLLSGLEGKRLPVRLECPARPGPACDTAAERLEAAGVPVSRAVLGAEIGQELLRIVVAELPELEGDPAARLLAFGPQASGVFARPAGGNRALQLLDAGGAVRRTLGPGAGLVCATRAEDQPPTFVVTGIDAAGVQAAAAALDRDRLRRRFAVAVDGDRDVRLPVAASS